MRRYLNCLRNLALVALLALWSKALAYAAEPWLLLLYPEDGRFSINAGWGWQKSERCYPHLLLRQESASVHRYLTMQVWHRIGTPLPNIERTWSTTLSLHNRESSTVVESWTPTGAARTQSDPQHDTDARLQIAYQIERVDPLWRYGVEVATLTPTSDAAPWQHSFTVWAARALEPSVLTARGGQVLAKGTQPRSYLAAGVELAVNQSVGLQAAFQTLWPRASDLLPAQPKVPDLLFHIAVNRRYLDRSGWEISVQLGGGGVLFTAGRSVPLDFSTLDGE